MHLIQLYIVLILLFSCSNKPKEESKPIKNKSQTAFDSKKWKLKLDKDYPWRSLMTDALLYSDTLRVMSKEQVLDVLGQPDRIDNNYLFYTVSESRFVLFVLNQKTLVVVLSEDGSKNKVMLHN